MAFSEDLKLKVKKMAMFQCCRCQEINVEVHHIIPQQDHGPDTLENVAPLCPNCHTWFGDNPIKKKEITQMRDNWYEVVKRMYPDRTDLYEPLRKINNSLEELKKQSDLSDLKASIKALADQTIEKITPGTAELTATNFVKASMASGSSQPTVMGGSPGFLPKSTQCIDCGKTRDSEYYLICKECRQRKGVI